jgi:hypothetical protein
VRVEAAEHALGGVLDELGVGDLAAADVLPVDALPQLVEHRVVAGGRSAVGAPPVIDAARSLASACSNSRRISSRCTSRRARRPASVGWSWISRRIAQAGPPVDVQLGQRQRAALLQVACRSTAGTGSSICRAVLLLRDAAGAVERQGGLDADQRRHRVVLGDAFDELAHVRQDAVVEQPVLGQHGHRGGAQRRRAAAGDRLQQLEHVLAERAVLLDLAQRQGGGEPGAWLGSWFLPHSRTRASRNASRFSSGRASASCPAEFEQLRQAVPAPAASMVLETARLSVWASSGRTGEREQQAAEHERGDTDGRGTGGRSACWFEASRPVGARRRRSAGSAFPGLRDARKDRAGKTAGSRGADRARRAVGGARGIYTSMHAPVAERNPAARTARLGWRYAARRERPLRPRPSPTACPISIRAVAPTWSTCRRSRRRSAACGGAARWCGSMPATRELLLSRRAAEGRSAGRGAHRRHPGRRRTPRG